MSNLTSKTVEQNKSEIVITQHFSQEVFSISWQIHIPQTHFSEINSSFSSFLPTLLKRKALPVAPVKRVEMSSERLVRIVSQFAQENRRVPPIWSKKILPIFRTYVSLYSRPESKKEHHTHVKIALQQNNLNPIPYIRQNVLQTNSANDCSKSFPRWWITELTVCLRPLIKTSSFPKWPFYL